MEMIVYIERDNGNSERKIIEKDGKDDKRESFIAFMNVELIDT